MRVLALIFALIGAAGSGFVGLVGLDSIKKAEADSAAENARPGGPQRVLNPEKLKYIKQAIYGMIAGIPIGVIGGILALNRKGKLAAVLLLAAYAIPLVILAVGVGIDFSDERVKPIVLFSGGLVIAAVCALFVKSSTPYRAPAKERGLTLDDDLV